MEEARRPLRRAHTRAPRWSWIAAPLVAGFLVIGCAQESPTDVAGPGTTVERTTTTTERPTTTTTRRPTTTTAPPTTAPPTAAPPTTAPPPPPPPPTTAPPPPPPPPPPPAPPSNCNPNYTGCVPNASDVDCAGGSGNGPQYVQGPVQIIGGDPYDLDADNDGVGCE